MSEATVLDDLTTRGLLHDHTDFAGLCTLLGQGSVSVYHGIDPTAPSLHLGNLIGVLALRRFQDAGHRPIALVGGATGMVGDPSGRAGERKLLDEQQLANNVKGIRTQLERLLDFDANNAALLVNNLDWTADVGLLEFLRDIGKHITVNQMTAKDSIRSRLASETGISFTEFSYMLLQAYDFSWLHKHYGCELQIGGSDQWGNITAGIDLIRKRSGGRAHGLTWPLMTRSDGQKFGKTADGSVWLDRELTLPYEFHQYFLRVADADVQRLLLQLTLLDAGRIEEIMADHWQHPERRLAQQQLADSITTLVHGQQAVTAATKAAQLLYGGSDIDATNLGSIRGIVAEALISPSLLNSDEMVVDLVVKTQLSDSKSQARRAIAAGSVRVNGKLIRSNEDVCEPLGGSYFLVQLGKKHHKLAVLQQ